MRTSTVERGKQSRSRCRSHRQSGAAIALGGTSSSISRRPRPRLRGSRRSLMSTGWYSANHFPPPSATIGSSKTLAVHAGGVSPKHISRRSNRDAEGIRAD
jgi:hypothetical protein